MTFKLSQTSIDRLEGVHPDLINVVERAIEISPYDFGVSEGVRTLALQKQYVADGKSTTINSKHIPGEDGYSHAVDIFGYINGKVTWEHKYFRKIIQAFMTAAIELGIQIEAGGLWRDFLDSPHFQLNAKYYD